MAKRDRLPIGIEDFSEIRTWGYHYVDKTGLIKDLLDDLGKVVLFTRPRRFGKTLNMSMLRHFFSIGCDKSLFDGLQIMESEQLCEEYMGRYPVLSLSLKGVVGENYETARGMLVRLVNEETYQIRQSMEEERLSGYQKDALDRLMEHEMSDEDLMDSLRMLSAILYRYYGKKTIILIDEYDVPLDKAFTYGYYDRMVTLIGNVFSQALKTNDSLYLAVVTGCLRIAKESIFTGLNNLKVFIISSPLYDEYFGFTDREVQELLGYYGLEACHDTIRQWYDGYRFGDTDVYCPWDVLCYCGDLLAKPDRKPKAYWINTSGNSIVRHFIELADRKTKREIEQLIAGEPVRKSVQQELTYSEIYNSIDNLWSVLFLTGYLTLCGEADEKELLLRIPNQEIREIFVTQIQEWSRQMVRQDRPRIDSFCRAFRHGDAKAVEEQLEAYLKRTISIRDIGAKSPKENFYHGLLLGLLDHDKDWVVSSNAESGEGYSDILIEIEDEDIGIVIEIKYAKDGNIDSGCQAALKQILEKGYEEKLRSEGMKKILDFGIAFFKKRCRVVCRG